MSCDSDAQAGSELWSSSVFGSTVQEVGTSQAAVPSSSYTFPSVGRLFPPLLFLNAWLSCGAWWNPQHGPTVRQGACARLSLLKMLTCKMFFRAVYGSPCFTELVHDLQAGWEINLFHPFASVWSKFQSPPNSWILRLSEVGQNPVCRWWNLNFSPSLSTQASAWQQCSLVSCNSSRVTMLWNNLGWYWQSDPEHV